MAKLPVGAIASQSLDFAWSNFGTLLKIGWFPLSASAVFSLAAEMPLSGVSGVEGATGGAFLLALTGTIGATVLWAIFAVAVHRMILLDEVAPDEWFYFRLGKQEIRYAIAPFVLGGIFLLIILAAAVILMGSNILSAFIPASVPYSGGTSGIQVFGVWAAALLAIFVMIRLVLVMPIIVAEGKIGIRRAWIISSGNFWRLVGVNSLVMIAMMLFLFALGLVVAVWFFFSSATGLSEPLAAASTTGLFLAIIGGILSYLVLVFFGTIASLALLSFSYKALTDTDVTDGDGAISES